MVKVMYNETLVKCIHLSAIWNYFWTREGSFKLWLNC